MNALTLMAEFAARENAAARMTWWDADEAPVRQGEHPRGKARASYTPSQITDARVAAYVAAHPGSTTHDIRAALGITRTQFDDAQRRLRKAGKMHLVKQHLQPAVCFSGAAP